MCSGPPLPSEKEQSDAQPKVSGHRTLWALGAGKHRLPERSLKAEVIRIHDFNRPLHGHVPQDWNRFDLHVRNAVGHKPA